MFFYHWAKGRNCCEVCSSSADEYKLYVSKFEPKQEQQLNARRKQITKESFGEGGRPCTATQLPIIPGSYPDWPISRLYCEGKNMAALLAT